MTETVTGHQMGLYILEEKVEEDCSYDAYENIIKYTKILGVFTTLNNVRLAYDKVLLNTRIKAKDLTYRLVPKDQLLIDLPSITEKPEDVYSW